MTVGENIKYYRKEKGLSQSQLGALVGVSDKTISSWEINRTEPNMGMIEKICNALGCLKTDIISKDEQEKSKGLHKIFYDIMAKNSRILNEEYEEYYDDKFSKRINAYISRFSDDSVNAEIYDALDQDEYYIVTSFNKMTSDNKMLLMKYVEMLMDMQGEQDDD